MYNTNIEVIYESKPHFKLWIENTTSQTWYHLIYILVVLIRYKNLILFGEIIAVY
jgi:hypothetical protein